MFLDSAFEQLAGDNAPAALAILNDTIRLYPHSAEAYALRAALLWGQARGEEALADFDRVLELQPDNLQCLLDRCLLLESMGKERSVFIPCYQDVMDKMERRLPPGLLRRDTRYAFVAVLAEAPEAARIKKEFAESPAGAEDFDSLHRERIAGFDRAELKRRYDTLRELRQAREQPE